METCEKCKQLELHYERLIRVYNRTATAMEKAAITPSSDYVRLKRVADEARVDADIARVELDQHKRMHAHGFGSAF